MKWWHHLFVMYRRYEHFVMINSSLIWSAVSTSLYWVVLWGGKLRRARACHHWTAHPICSWKYRPTVDRPSLPHSYKNQIISNQNVIFTCSHTYSSFTKKIIIILQNLPVINTIVCIKSNPQSYRSLLETTKSLSSNDTPLHHFQRKFSADCKQQADTTHHCE